MCGGAFYASAVVIGMTKNIVKLKQLVRESMLFQVKLLHNKTDVSVIAKLWSYFRNSVDFV